VHVDPMAFSLKDRMLQRGGRAGGERSNLQNDDLGQVAERALGSMMRK
jgi:hypothetical protein